MLSRQACNFVFVVCLRNTMAGVIFGVSGVADVGRGSVKFQAFAAKYWITTQAKLI
jgi:hypothetical protein